MLDEQLVAGQVVEGEHESLKWDLGRTDRREYHETLPWKRARRSPESEAHWTKKASASG